MPYRGVWGDSAYFRVDKKLNSVWQMSEVAAVSSAAGRCHSVRGWRCVRSIVPLPRNVKINCETRAVLLMLRTYALYNRSRQVVGLLAAISAIGTGITVVRRHSHTQTCTSALSADPFLITSGPYLAPRGGIPTRTTSRGGWDATSG